MTKGNRQTKHEKTTVQTLAKIEELKSELARSSNKISKKGKGLVALLLVNTALTMAALFKGEIKHNDRSMPEKPSTKIEATASGLQSLLQAHEGSEDIKAFEQLDLMSMPLDHFMRVPLANGGSHNLYSKTVKRDGAELIVRSFDDDDYRSFEISEADGRVYSGFYSEDGTMHLEYREGDRHESCYLDRGKIMIPGTGPTKALDIGIFMSPSFPEITGFVMDKMKEAENPRESMTTMKDPNWIPRGADIDR